MGEKKGRMKLTSEKFMAIAMSWSYFALVLTCLISLAGYADICHLVVNFAEVGRKQSYCGLLCSAFSVFLIG